MTVSSNSREHSTAKYLLGPWLRSSSKAFHHAGMSISQQRRGNEDCVVEGLWWPVRSVRL